jgi:hypothetical protein
LAAAETRAIVLPWMFARRLFAAAQAGRFGRVERCYRVLAEGSGGRTCIMAPGSRLAVLLALLSLSAFTPARAWDGVRCEHGVARTGNSTEQVRALCGEPVHLLRHVETRAFYPDGSYTVLEGQGFQFAQRLDRVKVEEWVYPVGRQKLTCHMQFEDDKMVSARVEHED